MATLERSYIVKSYEELRESLEALVLRYKTNTEKCSAADLAGRYRVAYEALKSNIFDLASQMIKIRSFSDIYVPMDEEEETRKFVREVEQLYARDRIGARVSVALFERFSVPEAAAVMDELRGKVNAMYSEFLKKYTVLLVFKDISEKPLPYNRLLGAAYLDGKWIPKEMPSNVIAYISKEAM